jgi:hypothetical protein
MKEFGHDRRRVRNPDSSVVSHPLAAGATIDRDKPVDVDSTREISMGRFHAANYPFF